MSPTKSCSIGLKDGLCCLFVLSAGFFLNVTGGAEIISLFLGCNVVCSSDDHRTKVDLSREVRLATDISYWNWSRFK